MQAIILCGGLATRLGDATKSVPKVLLDIADRTVLEWQIQLLREADVEQVILASGHLHDVLQARVGTHYAGVSVRYAKEEKRLGTGGAIQNAMQYVTTSPFFVLNGDVLLANFSPQEMLLKLWRVDDRTILSPILEHKPAVIGNNRSQEHGTVRWVDPGEVSSLRTR